MQHAFAKRSLHRWLQRITLGGLAMLASNLAQGSNLVQADGLVQAELNGGKALVGELDSRTDSQELWLRWHVGTASLQRGIRWNDVKHLRLNQQPTTEAVLRQRAQLLSPGDAILPHAAIESGPHPPTIRSAAVRTVTCDAFIANWDQDPLFDGIVLEITALDDDGNSVPYAATIDARLETIRYSNGYSATSGGGRTLVTLGQWSKQWTPFTRQLRLDYGPHQPESEPTDRYARLRVRISIPGVGTFDRVIDGIRTRSFTPIANSLSR